jgi:hypothetical protein
MLILIEWSKQCSILCLVLVKGPNSINHLNSLYFVIISVVHSKVFLHIFLSVLALFCSAVSIAFYFHFSNKMLGVVAAVALILIEND